MAACGGGGGGGGARRSRLTAPSAPAPHSGAAAADHVPEVGELAEVVQGGVEIGDGETFLHVPIEMCGEGAAAPEVASGRAETTHRDSARDAMPVSVAGRDLAACAGGLRGSFDRSAELSALVVTLAAQVKSRDFALLFGIDAVLREILPIGDRTQQEARKFHFQTGLKVVVAYGGTPMHSQRVGSSTYLMVLKIEFVIDVMKRGFLLCPVGNQFVGVGNRKDVLSLVYVETQWETDPLRYWLYSKGFPATVVTYPMYNQCDLESSPDILVATPGDHVDFVEGSWISFEGIKYLFMDEGEKVLDMGFDTEKTKIIDMTNTPKESEPNDMLRSGKLAIGEIFGTKSLEKKAFLCWPYISSFRSWSRVCLFTTILALLIPMSSPIPVTYNTTDDTCPAPYLHAPFQNEPYLQFKRSVPTYGAPLFEKLDPECQSLFKLKKECQNQSSNVKVVSAAAGMISLLTNLAPLLLALDIRDADPQRLLLVGLSTLFYGEANLLWIRYLSDEECATYWSFIFVSIAAFWNLCYTIKFWCSTTDWNYKATFLLCAVLLGIVGCVIPTAAGILGLILTTGGHATRIMSGLLYAREYNPIILGLAFCGLASGSVLCEHNFEIMTSFKIASLISFVARGIDIALQFVFCYCHKGQHDDGNDRLANETNNTLRNPLLLTDVELPEQREVLQPDVSVEQRRTDRQEFVPSENEQSEKKEHSGPQLDHTDASVGNVVDVQRKVLQPHAVTPNGGNGQEFVPWENEQSDKENERSGLLGAHTDASLGNVVGVQREALQPHAVELNGRNEQDLPHAVTPNGRNGQEFVPWENEQSDKENERSGPLGAHTDASLGNVVGVQREALQPHAVELNGRNEQDLPFLRNEQNERGCTNAVKKTDKDGARISCSHMDQLTEEADGHFEPQLHEDKNAVAQSKVALNHANG